MDQFNDLGFVVLRGIVPEATIDLLMRNFTALVNSIGGATFETSHSPKFAQYLSNRKDIQSCAYDAIRQQDWLEQLCVEASLTTPLATLLGNQIALLKKIVFRIDTPMETAQLAVWHQDCFYVRGSLNTVTAWIPMQDTGYLHGCLQVMPGSHKLGPLPHETTVLGKRHMPTAVFDREIRLVEMKKGDVMLFHSCLLHSSGLNLSDVTRFSVQARYAPATEAVDPEMGGMRLL